MNVKRFLLATLAVFVTIQVLEFVIHNVLLSADYEACMEIWRQDMMEMMWLYYFVSVIMTLFFVYVFVKGYEGKGIMEGLRFGLIFGIGYHMVHILNQFFAYPLPWTLTIKWLAFGIIEFLIVGIVVSLVYKK